MINYDMSQFRLESSAVWNKTVWIEIPMNTSLQWNSNVNWLSLECSYVK